MERMPILGPAGHPVFQVGRVFHKQQAWKDYYVSLEWYTEGRRTEPCMVIWSATDMSGDPGAYLIARSSLGKFAEPDGRPTHMAFYEAAAALPMLGRPQLDFEIRKLVDCIMSFVDDVMKMRPKPPRPQETHSLAPMWEMTVKTRDGKTLKESTV